MAPSTSKPKIRPGQVPGRLVIRSFPSSRFQVCPLVAAHLPTAHLLFPCIAVLWCGPHAASLSVVASPHLDSSCLAASRVPRGLIGGDAGVCSSSSGRRPLLPTPAHSCPLCAGQRLIRNRHGQTGGDGINSRLGRSGKVVLHQNHAKLAFSPSSPYSTAAAPARARLAPSSTPPLVARPW
ncbi:hypothetical protein B0T22DRAFT_38497 [Podospora appendiculata]|uniref:Uncharacterized protein n=1 Tax=Podospora appendiculata TaxID=314037 RepID=A0AAE1CGD8_9PEZI|nr:hypothetical protein B0T22DRAFT_38497 [Podospora appendiculata]